MNIKSEETYTSKNISQLYNFPFRNFQEYKKAFSERLLLPSVTISFAIQWAENGINTPRFLKYQTKLFMKLPFFFMSTFLVLAIISLNWKYLLIIPVFIVHYLIFHPNFKNYTVSYRRYFVWVKFIILLLAIMHSKLIFIIVILALIIVWWAFNKVYVNSINGLIDKAHEDEDLFCKLWESGILWLLYNNGDTISVRNKK